MLTKFHKPISNQISDLFPFVCPNVRYATPVTEQVSLLSNSLGDDSSPVTTLIQHIRKDLNDKNTQIEYLQSEVQYMKNKKLMRLNVTNSKTVLFFGIYPLYPTQMLLMT